MALLVHFAQVVVLSRLLLPSEYGVAAMAASVFSLSSIFKDFGLSTSTLQVQNLDPQDTSNLFWIGLAISVTIACGTLALGPLVSYWFDTELVVPLMMGYALVFIISSIGFQPLALAQRAFRFKALAIWRITGLLSGFGVATLLALYGAGPWAIIGFAMTLETVTMVGAFSISKFVPGRMAHLGRTKGHLKFGGTLSLGGFLSYVTSNVDRLLIGRLLGAASLGFYTRAQGLLVLPMSKVLFGFKRFNLATLSRLADKPEEFRSTISRLLRLYLIPCSLFVVPAAAYADELVALLMGPKWAAVAPLFVILAPYIWVHVTSMMCFLAHVASADLRGLTGFYAINGIILTGSLLITIQYGLKTVTIGYCLAGFIGVQTILVFLAGRRNLINARDFVTNHFWNVLISAAAFILLKSFRHWLFDSSLPWVDLACGFAISVPVMLFLYSLAPQFKDTLRTLIFEAQTVINKLLHKKRS